MAKKKYKKSTKYEVIQRVKLVIDFLLDGLSSNEIIHYGSEKWKITGRQVETYIQYANKRIERMAGKAEQRAFDRIRARLERQYRRAIQKEDGQLARLLMQDIRKLYGLDKPEQKEIKVEQITVELIPDNDEDEKVIRKINK